MRLASQTTRQLCLHVKAVCVCVFVCERVSIYGRCSCEFTAPHHSWVVSVGKTPDFVTPRLCVRVCGGAGARAGVLCLRSQARALCLQVAGNLQVAGDLQFAGDLHTTATSYGMRVARLCHS